MTRGPLSGATRVAGVAGRPVSHSLSPLIHSAWIAAAGLDAKYIPVPVAEGEDSFRRLVNERRGDLVGLNVTVPFKEEALALADVACTLSRSAGAANLLLFHQNGEIEARNTDGPGLLESLATAPALNLAAGPVVVLGAGGAARGAAVALREAGAGELRLVNRSFDKAERLAQQVHGVRAYRWQDMAAALTGAGAVVNATRAGLNGEDDLDLPLEALPANAVVMDMVYAPLETGLLRAAKARGLATVDGLSMLIAQARPSFEAFYGVAAPDGVDVRALCLEALEARG